MPAPRSSPIIERRVLAARRYVAQPDDLAEMRHVIATMRDVPRDALESFPDLLHLLRRLSGRLAVIAGHLEPVEVRSKQAPRTRLVARPAADHAAIVAGVFGNPPRKPRSRRETKRTVTSREGKTVHVVERLSAQIEMSL